MDWKKNDVMDMASSRIINYSGKTLCDNYHTPLKACRTAAQAIRLYKNCISWALRERYPTKEDLARFTTREILAENGVYIDMEFDGQRIDNHICCVFLNCKGRIKTGLNISKAIIPMFYLSEGSDLMIEVDGGLLKPIPVELYYGSQVKGDLGRLAVRDCNGLTAKDNIGFTEEELNINPDYDNEDL